MNQTRRLGRGLEALLGQIPLRSEPQPAAAPPTLDFPPEHQPSHVAPIERPTAEPEAVAENSQYTEVQSAAEPQPTADAPPIAEPQPAAGATWVSVELIESNPAQPRQEFDPEEITSLAESIATHGVLQPVVVRRFDDHYQLVAGERRLRAARQAGKADVPVHIIEVDDRQLAELAIVENLQRKDLNPLEKAASFQRYLEQYGGTQEELARRLSIDRSTVANLIRLLELPSAVQDAVRKGQVTQGHARALLPLGDEREQIEFCERVQREQLSVRQTETLVQETITTADEEQLAVVDRNGKALRPRKVRTEHVRKLEQELKAALGMKVTLTHNAKGRGKLVVYFANHDEFDRLRHHITDPLTESAKAG
ncbi:MAG: ParB/RepB/Spo0J family partition protein [Patescibacteria group bacterium]|nr:ParB/RepB/Spo0J family partition protein [Patescibacteria group bacterium]